MQHAITRLGLAPSVGWVVVAVPADHVDRLRAELRACLPATVGLDVVAGGSTRTESVAAALAAAPVHFRYLVVHDAARSFAPPELVERVCAALRLGHRAVIPVLEVVDTVKQIDESGHPHPGPVAARGADPAGVRPGDAARRPRRRGPEPATDDAGLVERIGAVVCVPGTERP